MKIGAFVMAVGLALRRRRPSLAEPTTLSGDELRQAISGKTVYLNISGFELPIRYAANGRMSGKMSTIAASFSRGDGSSDTGKWWVADDQLCQQWSSWMDGKSLLLQAHAQRLDGAVGAERRPFRHRPHRRLTRRRVHLARSLIVQEPPPGGSSAFRVGSVMRMRNRRAERRRRAQTQLWGRCR